MKLAFFVLLATTCLARAEVTFYYSDRETAVKECGGEDHVSSIVNAEGKTFFYCRYELQDE